MYLVSDYVNCQVLPESKENHCIADYRIMLRCFLYCLLFLMPLDVLAAQPWVVINTARGTVAVHQAKRTVLKLKGAAFGRGGVSDLHLEGDGSTPRGVFHIVHINRHSRFRLFFELNYPTMEQARLGYLRGLISLHVLRQIRHATSHGLLPPQDTRHGGGIGIHGLGNGSLWVHRRFNWTDGCIALTNRQIEKLAQWLEIGTRVVIK